jgi:hypothetical protein
MIRSDKSSILRKRPQELLFTLEAETPSLSIWIVPHTRNLLGAVGPAAGQGSGAALVALHFISRKLDDACFYRILAKW